MVGRNREVVRIFPLDIEDMDTRKDNIAMGTSPFFFFFFSFFFFSFFVGWVRTISHDGSRKILGSVGRYRMLLHHDEDSYLGSWIWFGK